MLFVTYEIIINEKDLIIERIKDDIYIYIKDNIIKKHISELHYSNTYSDFKRLFNFNEDKIKSFLKERVLEL